MVIARAVQKEKTVASASIVRIKVSLGDLAGRNSAVSSVNVSTDYTTSC